MLKKIDIKKWDFTLGVDVSKHTLDISCAELNEHTIIDNTIRGFINFKKWCQAKKIKLRKSIIVMEYTGGYEYRLVKFCDSRKIKYARISGLEIKKSLGIVRGKNDKVDAGRIARYAQEKIMHLKLAQPLNLKIMRLKELLSFRKRLVRESAGYKATNKEKRHMFGSTTRDVILNQLNKKCRANNKYIEAIENEMMSILENDHAMSKNYDLITSIKGIGNINALMTIAYTENFTSFTNARSYAVYAGVAPFEYTSGISIKGRKRISHLANKEVKQELNQAARVAMTCDKELRAYGERKMQKKCYPLVLNNIKFKLILRMFSVVKRGEKYTENYYPKTLPKSGNVKYGTLLQP